ncbi:hypothetical protein [Acetobacterium bakii]|uniref:HNH endonuclease n=1 Tax=Acetobacterium bakii TaxID=52689 RepID=A0A0L6TWB7_9FIRM|nr:hypothetical protein [Acetobacterium bakii]KNZ40571.1 hypothetical protein AKG39_17100 [Acetobacterium bakii]
MAKKKIGNCALCPSENVELLQSHIIPKAIYKRTKIFENSRFRSFYNPHEIFQDGEKKTMLCHDCEEFFSWYETKFSNLFLDKYLANLTERLPEIKEDIDFYIFTVAWRVLYDDLYVCNSFSDNSERDYLIEYEQKLRRFLYQRYLEKQPGKKKDGVNVEIPNLEGKCFGEIIAEIEKCIDSTEPEDISEIKNYVYTLKELGFSGAVETIFDFMIWGYSFYTSGMKYVVLTGYNGLLLATVYHRSRNILITDDLNLLRKSGNSEAVIKEELINQVNELMKEMKASDSERQSKLNQDGLREKIEKRCENQTKLR